MVRLAPLALLAAVSLVACKGKPEKICANLEAIMAKEAPDKPLSAADKASCVADIQRELAQCENSETIAFCYVEATSLDAIATCQSKCQKKPPSRAKPGGSAAPSASD